MLSTAEAGPAAAYELVLAGDGSGRSGGGGGGGARILGSREFARYYRQRPRLTDGRASVQAAQVQAQYRRLAVPLLVSKRLGWGGAGVRGLCSCGEAAAPADADAAGHRVPSRPSLPFFRLLATQLSCRRRRACVLLQEGGPAAEQFVQQKRWKRSIAKSERIRLKYQVTVVLSLQRSRGSTAAAPTPQQPAVVRLPRRDRAAIGQPASPSPASAKGRNTAAADAVEPTEMQAHCTPA